MWDIPGPPSLNMEKPAALPKPLEASARVFTPQTQELPLNPEDSQKQHPDQPMFSLPLLSPDAVRLQKCVWRPPTQQQPKEMQRWPPSNVKRLTVEGKSRLARAQGIENWPLVWTVDGRHRSSTRTMHYAADIAACRNVQQNTTR